MGLIIDKKARSWFFQMNHQRHSTIWIDTLA
jgi:hypothetical protein